MKKINIVTLGCSKNTVDSEVLAGHLTRSGYEIFFDSEQHSDYVIINTCGFINDAKEESIDMILRFAEARKNGEIQKLAVMGCLSERYKKDLINEIPEVDTWYGVNDIDTIVRDLDIDWRKQLVGERVLSTPHHFSYLKIAEGCDRRCSFCAIPMIRGKHHSRSMNEILSEARHLSSKGVKELLLISQDLTYYGKDLSGDNNTLAELVDKMATQNPQTWIRLHYTFPLGFTDELIDVFNAHDNVVNYVDIPLQHISTRILKSMHRGIDSDGTKALMRKIRKAIPNAAIRTSLIVGYPGETEEEFAELMDFVREYKFERMGVFVYSHEEDTSAYLLEDDVPAEEKDRRRDVLMDLQQGVSFAHNQLLVGKNMKVLIDREEGDFWIGRTEFDSPEVDNEVLISANGMTQLEGTFANVLITRADDYDLYAEIVS